MLEEQFTAVQQVKTSDELRKEVIGFTRRLGFETVDAVAVADHFGSASEFGWVDNTPQGYREMSESRENGRRDPVAQHCKHSSVPIVWNQETYTSAGQGPRWEVQARFGYCTGIALALHLPRGRHFFIGVDRDQPLPANSAEITRMTAELQLFAVHALDAAIRVLLPEPAREEEMTDLTPRELESLRWTMEGKTAWELGRILGISEQTAARHVHNATKKLDCVNKLQAVPKALRLGLIH